MKFYSCYKGIYYRFFFANPKGLNTDTWVLSEVNDCSKKLMRFSANYYRIDECFSIWFQEHNKI